MNRRTLHRVGLIAAIAAAAPLLVGGLAQGTPGDRVTSAVTARGTSEDKIKSRGNQPFDVVVQSITIQPGGHSGWHSHPGQAIVVIKSGTFTTYDASDKTCSRHVYDAGEVYVDDGHGHVHIARNEGSVPLEVQVTYIDVPVGAAFRTDAPRPGNCPF
ncbi:MAG TPA: cupin domain-containing protein [Mycobacteriales bacterium]|nr:cupin domain-containing protein [Mycobacteriales bacterium]